MLTDNTVRCSLTSGELEGCRPMSGENGRAVRAFCPFHRSDRQRSLRVIVDTGRFSCFACGAWGYLDRPVEQASAFSSSRVHERRPPVARERTSHPSSRALESAASSSRPDPDLAEDCVRFQAALPGSLGERYLRWRGIPLELAQTCGIGYAEQGQWPHRDPRTGRPVRQWKYGRLVFPHTDPRGRVVNLYGRAIGSASIPKQLRHDHLPGRKGFFNADHLTDSTTPVYVCEGPFDALSLLAAGARRAVAIFGVAGWNWEWARNTASLVFAFDADAAGARWRTLARQCVLHGKQAFVLPASALAGHKDINEAWTAGRLRLPDI
jgi:DNA primase